MRLWSTGEEWLLLAYTDRETGSGSSVLREILEGRNSSLLPRVRL